MVTEREGQSEWLHFVTLHLRGVEADGSDRNGFTAPPGSLPVAPSSTQCHSDCDLVCSIVFLWLLKW